MVFDVANTDHTGAEEGPEASANPTVINQFLYKSGMCFHHARGEPWKAMDERGRCRLSHDPDVVPRAAYPPRNHASRGATELVILTEEEKADHGAERDSN